MAFTNGHGKAKATMPESARRGAFQEDASCQSYDGNPRNIGGMMRNDDNPKSRPEGY